jgi:hypothetical protein
MSPPAVIASVVRNATSSVTLYFENSPNSTNVIQAATNLATAWQNITTNVADGNGIWQLTDTNTSASPTRFYRP